jgi:hypothetical protein
MFQNFYDKVIVLSQKERKDRRKIFQREADIIGLQFEWFDSLEKATPRDSFNHSHYNILKNSLLEHYEKVLVLEDDCSFRRMDMFWPIHIQLESLDWNWMYYGANLRPYPDHIEPMACTANLRTIQAAYTTHAIGYTKSAMNAVVSLYKPEMGMMFDAWLDEYLLRSMPAHISYPFLCVQKPTFSDLWNRNVDYQDTFIASEEYIKDIC